MEKFLPKHDHTSSSEIQFYPIDNYIMEGKMENDKNAEVSYWTILQQVFPDMTCSYYAKMNYEKNSDHFTAVFPRPCLRQPCDHVREREPLFR